MYKRQVCVLRMYLVCIQGRLKARATRAPARGADVGGAPKWVIIKNLMRTPNLLRRLSIAIRMKKNIIVPKKTHKKLRITLKCLEVCAEQIMISNTNTNDPVQPLPSYRITNCRAPPPLPSLKQDIWTRPGRHHWHCKTKRDSPVSPNRITGAVSVCLYCVC